MIGETMKQMSGHFALLAFCAILMAITVFLQGCGNDTFLREFNPKDTDTTDEDTGETNEETLPPDDSSAGLLKYSLTQIACPACFNETNELDVRMEALFHLPISSSWLSGLSIPERGSCVANLPEVIPSINKVSVGNKIDFIGGWSSGVMTERAQDPFGYSTGYMAEANYNRDTWHDLLISDHNILIKDAFKSIHGFDYIEPYELLWIDPSYAFSVALFRSGMSFSWGPYGSDDDFLIIVSSYDPLDGSYIGNIACTNGDTGSMHIPAEYASKLPHGSLASVHFQRHKFGRFAFNHFPSFEHPVWIETHMFWEAVGTGYIE